MRVSQKISLLSVFLASIAAGATARQAFADTVCASSLGAINVGNGFVQLNGYTPIAVTREVGPVDTYRGQDGAVILRIANPAYAGAQCRNSPSHLPHAGTMSICRAQLDWDRDRTETLSCYITR